MSSDMAGDQHKEIAYAEIEVQVSAGLKFGVTWEPGNEKVTITGSCPGCYGRTSTDFSPGIPDTKFRGPRVPRLPSQVTLYCECGHMHKDRPAEALDHGCGRYWLLDVAATDRVHPRHLK